MCDPDANLNICNACRNALIVARYGLQRGRSSVGIGRCSVKFAEVNV
jgi:hypothetical protein